MRRNLYSKIISHLLFALALFSSASYGLALNLTMNGEEGLDIKTGTSLSAHIDLYPEAQLGANADYWIKVTTPASAVYWLRPGFNWNPVTGPVYQGGLVKLTNYFLATFPTGTLPLGTYTFVFGVDNNMDGIPNFHHSDTCRVVIHSQWIDKDIQFVHRAVAANISGNYTVIDHPELNNNPDAQIQMAPNYNPGGAGGVYSNHAPGVWYTGTRWAVFNQDLAAMAPNATFNVLISRSQAQPWVHQATLANISSNWTTLDHPALNGNPNAKFLVTQNWNPGGLGGTYNNHPVGLWYTGTRWAIFNQDLAAMPANAAFNILIPEQATETFTHTASAANIASNWTTIDHPALNGNPNAQFQLAQNWNPGGAGGTYNSHAIGVWYTGSRWAVFNQDLVAMPLNASFNILLPVITSRTLVHQAASWNITSNWSFIDNPALNNKPAAKFLVTQNWNPGGAGGTYNNHEIGVWYNASIGLWAVFNQDLAALPANSAYNLHIPGPELETLGHQATVANINGHWTEIDHPDLNGNPAAQIQVGQNWNPGGAGGTYNSHVTGIWYTGTRWAIFNQDFAPMPVNAAFNILVPGPGSEKFVHAATVASISGNYTLLDHPDLNGKPNAKIQVTQNWNPGGVGGVYNDHKIGVWYTGSRWSVFNQDLAAMTPNASFNVLIVSE